MMLEQVMNPFSLSLISFLFVALFLYNWLSTKKETLKKLPPSPQKFPVIGNLHQLSPDLHISLQFLAKKYGPLMLLHIGSVPVLVVSSADAAREVMKTHDLVFSNRPKLSIISKIFKGTDVAFAPYSEYWRQVKSICVVQLLSNRRTRSFHNVRDAEVTLLIQKIKDSRSTTVNLSELFTAFTTNIVSRVAIGRKYEGGEGNTFKTLFGEISELLGYFSFEDYIPWLYWIDVLKGLNRKVERLAKEVDIFLEGVIRDHNITLDNDNCAAAHQDFVSILLEIQKENNNSTGFSIDKDSIKAVTLDMFGAGIDTTSTAIEWTMAELIKNPLIMSKLQNEVREIGRAKSRISEGDLDKMQYLKAVIKESMRMNTPIPLLVPREAREDVKVMGYDIKKGTQVLINAWAIGRDPSFWDNPEEFWPERFLNSPMDYKGIHFEFLPFGAGRRGCPGIQFAMIITELVIANVVHLFDFELPNGKRMEDLDMGGANGITVHKRDPLLVIATPCA